MLDADSLNELAYQAIVTVDVESTLKYAQEALILSQEADYSKGRASSNFYIAQTLFNLGSFDESLKYLEKARSEEYAKQTPLVQFEICRIRGRIYSNLKLEEQALKSFRSCLTTANKLKNENHRDYCRSLTYENFAHVFKSQGKTDSLQHYLFKNKELLEAMPEEFILNNKVNMYASLGEYFISENEYALALSYLKKSLNLAQSYNFPYLSRAYMFMGDVELLRDSTDLALSFYQEALSNLEQTKLKTEYPLLYQKIANLYELKSMPDSVIAYEIKQTTLENVLAQEKIEATKQALGILISEEKKQHRDQLYIYALYSLFIFLVFAFIVYFLWRKRDKKLNYKIEVANKNLKHTKQEAFDELIKAAESNSPTFLTRFTEFYPEFMEALLEKHPNLTNSDLHLCAMVYLNFSTKEISKYTYLAVRSVQTKRSRLRKKLNLSPKEDFYQYIRSFDKS